MFDRIKLGAMLLIGIALPIMGCGSAQVDSLEVTPSAITMAIGTTAQLTATGVYSHGTSPSSTQNLTDQVTWTTASADVATVSATGMVTATGPGVIQITASIKGYTGLLSASATITVSSSGTTSPTSNDITKLTIIPGSQTVAAPGDTATYTVVGTTAAGASVNANGLVVWSSSSTGIATVNASTGVVTAVGPGTATITAEYTNADQTVATGTATFTVTGGGASSTDIASVTIIPGAQTVAEPGNTAAYSVIGTNTAGQTQSLTGLVVWSASSPQIATVNATTGVATAVGPGTATIAAQFTNPDKTTATGVATFTVTGSGSTNSDIASVTIIPNAQTVAEPGDTAAYSVIGTNSAGQTKSLTGLVVWSSSSPQIATVNATTGVATAVGPGTATISAQYTNSDQTTATGIATFTVTGNATSSSDITSITIIPGAQSVPASGDTATYVAVGTTGAGTTVSLSGLVTWTSTSPQIATIAPATGVSTAVGPGTTTIIAQYVNADKTTATGTATLTVSGNGTSSNDITQVSIVPSSQTVAAPGDTATYTATGTTASGITKSLTNVVWNASSPQIANITAGGVATAVGQGTTTISAQYTNADGTVATGTATFSVTASGTTNNDITSITIIPGSQSVPAPGDQATFIAIGTTASGSTISLQGLATYASSSSTIAQITNSATGVVTGVAAGSATITATYTNADGTIATGTATFTVLGGTTEQWTALTITPSSQTISASSGQADFIALATSGSTGLIENVTSSTSLTWSSSNTSVVTTAPGGVVTGAGVGSATITALLANQDGSVVSATASVTTEITTPPSDTLLSLTIIPSSISVSDFLLSGQFLAVATYSTPPFVQDVTNSPNTTWLSSEPEFFPVDTNSAGNSGASAGLVTAYASGGAVIIAETQTGTGGPIQTATATFNCPEVLPPPPGSLSQTPGSCYPGEPPAAGLLETLTVYNEGLDTTNWLVTAPSATGTQDVLHCGPGWVPTQQYGTGSVCTATYPVGTAVILTATQSSGATGTFGGWSYNCVPSDSSGNPLPGPTYWTAAGPNYCVVTLSSNDTVGAIFN